MSSGLSRRWLGGREGFGGVEGRQDDFSRRAATKVNAALAKPKTGNPSLWNGGDGFFQAGISKLTSWLTSLTLASTG